MNETWLSTRPAVDRELLAGLLTEYPRPGPEPGRRPVTDVAQLP